MKKDYNIKLTDGTLVPVTEEVYRAYKQSQWRESNRRRAVNERERSLEQVEEGGVHITSQKKLVEQIVEEKLLLEMLLKALETLTEDERFLIDEIYFQEKTIREVASEVNIPFQTVHSKRNKIIEKLKKILKI